MAIVALLLLPFLSGEGEKSWRRRPIAVLAVMLIAMTLGTFTHLAGYAPWSPHMNAWSGDPVPEHLLRGTTALDGRVRSCSRRNSVVTAMPSATAAASEALISTAWPCGSHRIN